jgi:hypothetical protein
MKLWKEYAIEPSLFANYHLGNEILAGIGIEHGRIVGAVPKKWAQRVREVGLANNRPGDQLRLVEKLNGLKPAIIARNYPYDGTRPWIDQVLECHVQVPFDGILASGANASAAVSDASAGVSDHDCWESERKLDVPRTSADIAEALSLILARARDVIIVDAYFNPAVALAQSKWLRPLSALGAKLRTDGQLSRFEVHALSSNHEPWPAGMFSTHCRNNLPAALPRGIALNAVLWKIRAGGVQFHERLLVTDLGGVVVDPGIDDGQAGEIYTLRLLGRKESQTYLSKFALPTAPYDLVEQIRITR